MDEDIKMADLSQGPSDAAMLAGPSKNLNKNKLGKQSGILTKQLAYKHFLEEFRKTVPEKTESEQMLEAAAKWSSMSLEERQQLCYPEKQLHNDDKTEEGKAEEDLKKMKDCFVS
ncbi:GL22132 [Drosophila persimilis]|uniref:GL22132 n=1 Tax=Drosophila persimilis TaxID=7234 RepID=B4GF33_DROPE|nr:uncharacterized protein LOC6591616 [Drosophila persimilis]EDW34218.1 GL22132 [Drosophila persimilis]